MRIKKIKSRYKEAELLKEITAYTAHADLLPQLLPEEIVTQ